MSFYFIAITDGDAWREKGNNAERGGRKKGNNAGRGGEMGEREGDGKGKGDKEKDNIMEK